jgi:hypothetical protein
MYENEIGKACGTHDRAANYTFSAVITEGKKILGKP